MKRKRGEFLEESPGQDLNHNILLGFVVGVREGPATQPNVCLQWSPERPARTNMKIITRIIYPSLTLKKKKNLFKYCLCCEEPLRFFGVVFVIFVCFFLF